MNKACETCIQAKQTRCSFPLSNNKTTDTFEMIHCDIWGHIEYHHIQEQDTF